MKNCTKCKIKMSVYSDGVHDVSLCWKCGKFDGRTKVNDDFANIIRMNPTIIMDLIKSKQLKAR